MGTARFRATLVSMSREAHLSNAKVQLRVATTSGVPEQGEMLAFTRCGVLRHRQGLDERCHCRAWHLAAPTPMGFRRRGWLLAAQPPSFERLVDDVGPSNCICPLFHSSVSTLPRASPDLGTSRPQAAAEGPVLATPGRRR